MNRAPLPFRMARSLGALGALAALVVGVPWALVRFIGAPWPSAMPDFASTKRSLEQTGVSTDTIIKLVAIVVWVAWVRLALAVVIEVIAALRHRPAPQMRALGSTQRVAAGLVASFLVLFGGMHQAVAATRVAALPGSRTVAAATVSPAVRVGPAPASGSASTLDSGAPTHATLTRTSASSVSGAEPGRVSKSGAAQSAPAATRAASPSARAAGPVLRPDDTPRTSTWVVERGDSFWRIAERHLGDGQRWHEIVAANIGHQVAPGIVFDASTEAIHPGWVLALPATAAPGRATTTTTTTTATAAASAPTKVTVQRGDTLGSIARDSYGEAAEWPTIWDANRGHEFDGRTFDDPDVIMPGWQLVIPDDLAAPVVVTTTDAPTPPGAVNRVADPSSCLPDLRHVPIRPVGSSAKAAPGVATQGDARASAGTSGSGAVTPADTSVIGGAPVVGGASVVVGEAGAAGQGTAASVPGPASNRNDRSDSAGEATERRATAPLGWSAAGLLATGAIGLVTARRRAAMRAAAAGARLAGLTEPMIRLERELREVAEVERIARLDLAVRAAHEQIGNGCLVGALVHTDGEIELIVERAGEPSAPFLSGDEGRWVLPDTIALEDIVVRARFAAFPCPGLLQVGRVAASKYQVDVFVDLEAVGLLQVAGADETATSSIVRALALGLALSPFAEQARLVTCGVPIPPIDGPITATEVATADEAIDLAADLLTPILGALHAGQTTAQLRSMSAGEAWEPALVLLAAASVDRDVANGLPGLCRPAGRGLAVVTDSREVLAEAQLVGGVDGWLLSPLNLRIDPIGISVSDAERLADLIDTAGAVTAAPPRPLVALDSPGRVTGDRGDEPGVVTLWQATEWMLMTRMLGPLDVVDRDGNAVAFERTKALELVTWLVEHRGSATRRGARTALWDGDVQDATFANVVSDARRNLARLVAPPGGDEWIGRSLSDHLAVHPLLVSDLDVLRSAVASARTAPARVALAALQSGLALVRDMPFAASTALWADAEGTASQAMLVVTEAAILAAEHCLTLGDLSGLFDATARGLLAVPGHEELIALRMRAHAAAGDLAGVRSEWASYERVLHADRWSSGEPAPKLAALRRELLGSRAA